MAQGESVDEVFYQSPAAAGSGLSGDNSGDTVDAEIVGEETTVVDIRSGTRRDKPGNDGAKTGPPRVDEWQDFFARIVLGFLSDAYIQWAFNGIDEEALTPREIEKLKLRDDERERIAKPFAELANKLKITRKHGRLIIASAGTAESVWALGLWAARVNHIAAKYRPVTIKPERRQRYERAGSHEAPTGSAGNNGQAGYTIIQPGTG